MVQRDNLRFSPISSHSLNSLQGQSRECDTPPGPLIRPFSNLVPQNQQDQSYFPLYSSEGHSIPPRDLGPIFLLDDLIDPAVKQQCWGMTVGTTTLLGKAVGEDTSSRRDTNIEAFRRWLSSKELWRFSIIHIVEFLAQNQSSFANHRTAIASRLHLNAGIDIVEFPLMKRLSQAIRRECPIEPKYSEMWNLEILFDYLRKHLPEEGHFISHRARAVTLVRTSIAGRTSDVAHIHRPSMVWTETTVRFRFFHWKTQHTERRCFSKYYVIEKLPLEKDRPICAFSALKAYVNLNTAAYNLLDCETLWLHHRGNRTIKPTTLAGDTQKLMKNAGIDSKFGPATIRHATITYWRMIGIPMAVVMERTGHKLRNLVEKFYNRADFGPDLMVQIFANAIPEDDDQDLDEEDFLYDHEDE